MLDRALLGGARSTLLGLALHILRSVPWLLHLLRAGLHRLGRVVCSKFPQILLVFLSSPVQIDIFLCVPSAVYGRKQNWPPEMSDDDDL